MQGGPTSRPDPPALTGDDIVSGSEVQPQSSVKRKKNSPAASPKYVLNVPPELNYKGDPPHWMRQLFLEPLLDGWKREIVARKSSVLKVSDVYYYNPEGKKFRSRREIGQYLQDNKITKYTAECNFSFNGKPLGGEFEPYEILRFALAGPGARPGRPKGQAPSTSTCSTYNVRSQSSTMPSLSRPRRGGSPFEGPSTFGGAMVVNDAPSQSKRKPSTSTRPFTSKRSVTSPHSPSSNGHASIERPLPDNDVMVVDDDEEDPEAGMIFDEEIEMVGTDDGQDAVFDPAVLSVREEPVRITHLPVVRDQPPAQRSSPHLPPPKKRKLTQPPIVTKRYCICDDVEYGNMVRCDNDSCEIEWYHFSCVMLKSGPVDKWYCPICRGATSDVLGNIPK